MITVFIDGVEYEIYFYCSAYHSQFLAISIRDFDAGREVKPMRFEI